MGDQNKTKDQINMAKQLSFSNESREALEKGVNFVANAVKVTIGPKAKNVVI